MEVSQPILTVKDALISEDKNLVLPEDQSKKLVVLESLAELLVLSKNLLDPDSYSKKVQAILSQVGAKELHYFIKCFDRNISEILTGLDIQYTLVEKQRRLWKKLFISGEDSSKKILEILKKGPLNGKLKKEEKEEEACPA